MFDIFWSKNKKNKKIINGNVRSFDCLNSHWTAHTYYIVIGCFCIQQFYPSLDIDTGCHANPCVDLNITLREYIYLQTKNAIHIIIIFYVPTTKQHAYIVDKYFCLHLYTMRALKKKINNRNKNISFRKNE